MQPRLPTGVPSAFGQPDVEGNIGFFNNLDGEIIGVELGLIVPIGAGSISGPFTLTVGSITKITSIISQFPAQARLQYDGSGNIICPIPGSYLMNFNFNLTVTSPTGATYYVQPYLFQGASQVVADTITIPNTLITNVPLSYNTLFFITPAAIKSGGNLIGVGVLVNGVASGQVTAVDQQVDYIGNMSGNSDFHPTMALDVAIFTDEPPETTSTDPVVE